ncbi:hypothetical protein EQ500_04895, partial [Lactobacillus sp. XV13L]|nr:hypothetical protein [Lactobacillus sp. XV13L]
MASGLRENSRKVNQEQSGQYKKVLAFVIFLLVTLTISTVTFLNPFFMKGQIRTSNNEAVVVRQVNKHFDVLAATLGANKNGNPNLLTNKQTQPIADHIIDYTLVPWVKFSNMNLAKQILHDIDLNIDAGSSSDAQLVQEKLQKRGVSAPYDVIDAFNLNTITVGSNIAFVLLLINIAVVVMAVISLRSIIDEMRVAMASKKLAHEVTAAGMWAGFWIIMLAGMMALVPVVFNVENLAL